MPADRASALQVATLAAVCRLKRGTAAAIRDELSPSFPREYTTIATVLTRLAERGVLRREKRDGAWIYEPAESVADFLAAIVSDLLAGLDRDQRSQAMARLLSGLSASERTALGVVAYSA